MIIECMERWLIVMLYLWMHKINDIFDKFRKNKYLQLILGLLPCLFCFIYTSAFLVDTLNTYGVLSINNDVIKESIRKDALMDVVKEKDGYKIFSNDTIELEKKDGFICDVLYEFGYDSIYYVFKTVIM